ncbi:MAG: RimK/LysX family protein [Rudanella sp.]|nr:RimK/LysX family protein [Rudanella sp.]
MTEVVDFPDLALMAVEAKIDTGAYTSALHCKDVCLFETEHETILSFCVIEPGGSLTRRIYSDTFTQRIIKNSFGVAEKRYVIKTKIVLFGRKIRAEFTLADREQMRYPVLLGRKLLRNRFIVDVSQKNLSTD